MGQKPSAIIIEEEAYAIERVREILSRFGSVPVTNVSDAKEARLLLSSNKYDIVISDMYIKGASGLEMLHLSRKTFQEVCFIAVSSVKDEALAQKALKEGAFDYVIKPPGLDRLANILRLAWILKGWPGTET